jgi:ADP-ribose pyrophosphatase
MKLVSIDNVFNSYLKMYQITSKNNDGEIRNYEMVSRTGDLTLETMGEKVNAVMAIPLVGDKVLLSREFRIPVNRWVYNFPAGLIDPGETIEEAAIRELQEETGLKVNKIIYVLPPSYTSAGLTDERLAIVFVKAEGEIIGSDNVNEEIESGLYSFDELKEIVNSSYEMCSRTQLVALMLSFMKGAIVDI